MKGRGVRGSKTRGRKHSKGSQVEKGLSFGAGREGLEGTAMGDFDVVSRASDLWRSPRSNLSAAFSPSLGWGLKSFGGEA